MTSKIASLAGLMLAAIVVVLTSPSCGVRTDDHTGSGSQFYQGSGPLPGIIGNQGGPGQSGELPPVTQINNGNDAAPLGTNPEYDVNQGGAVVTPVNTGEGSRSTSSLATGQQFKLNRITLAPKGQQPNWSSTSFVFNEGDTVDFYAEYEAAANVQFTRKWTMDSCGLNYAEPPTSHPVAGTYLAMFRYTIPIGTASDNADFNFEVYYGTRTTSAVKHADVVVGGGDAPNFNIIDITMAHDGDAPDWSLSHQQFVEGQDADLWIKYEMLAHNMNINRHWLSSDIGLDQTDFGVPTPQGVYTIKLDWHIPTGAVKNNCVFQYDLSSGAIQKFSEPFYYDILWGGGAGSVGNYYSSTSIVNYTASDPGIWCGHIDVDTSHLIYLDNKGSTDGHIHEYDDKFNTRTVDYMHLATTTLHNIQTDITDPNQKFKIIVGNADLSPGARIVINKTYNENDPSTYVLATAYDDIPLANLPIYSLSGVAGSTKLTSFSTQYLTSAIHDRQVIGTVTGSVRANTLGPNGEARNGALIVQAVKVNADGSNAFTTNLARTKGGVQGVAATGLAWESTTFWHWGGPSYNQAGWATYDPSADLTCDPISGAQGTAPTVLASGGGNFQIKPLAGVTKSYYPGTSGVSAVTFPLARMYWEDLQNSTDYDYNEFVGDLSTTEWRDSSGALRQLKFYVKALARGATDNTKAWQFNMDGAFPGTNAQAKVDQFYDDGNSDITNDTPHIFQSIWNSTNGINVPIFITTRDALPKPADSTATTNAVSNTTFVEGDYALVTVTFETPVAAGSYTPAPYNPELRVQQGTNAAYIYHLWRKKGDALLANGYPAGGFIVPANSAPWMLEGKTINTAYPAWDKWIKWLGTAASDDPRDPNAYLLPNPATGASVFGDPQTKAYWTGGTGQTDFHTQVSGEMDTLTLLKYLNGDATVTNSSISKEVLNPCKVSKSYDTHLPLALTNITATNSNGFNDFKTYVNNGVATTKPMEYQLGAQLIMLVMNVERGHVKPNEWVWCPEIGQIRPIVTDPHMPTRKGLIAEANAAFALPAGTANDTTRQMWRDILTRVNLNTSIVQQQYWDEPTPKWYAQTPVANYFQRSLFK